MKSLTFLMLLLSAAVIAQKPVKSGGKNPSPEKKAEASVKRWTEKLSLSIDQQTAAKPIFANMFTQLQSAKADTAAGKKVQKKQILAIRTDAENKFKALLSAEQIVNYDAAKKEMIEKRKQGQGKVSKEQSSKQQLQDELIEEDLF